MPAEMRSTPQLFAAYLLKGWITPQDSAGLWVVHRLWGRGVVTHVQGEAPDGLRVWVHFDAAPPPQNDHDKPLDVLAFQGGIIRDMALPDALLAEIMAEEARLAPRRQREHEVAAEQQQRLAAGAAQRHRDGQVQERQRQQAREVLAAAQQRREEREGREQMAAQEQMRLKREAQVRRAQQVAGEKAGAQAARPSGT